MSDAMQWLRKHPKIKARAAQIFGTPLDKVQTVLLQDMALTVTFAEALSRAASEFDAPDEVIDMLVSFTDKVRKGVAATERRGNFARKTLGSIAGLQEVSDIKMVLRGAQPHAPTDMDRVILTKANQTLSDPRSAGLETGGSLPACLLGCFLCEIFCLECCIILFETAA